MCVGGRCDMSCGMLLCCWQTGCCLADCVRTAAAAAAGHGVVAPAASTHRFPIGKTEQVKTWPYDTVQTFWRKW